MSHGSPRQVTAQSGRDEAPRWGVAVHRHFRGLAVRVGRCAVRRCGGGWLCRCGRRGSGGRGVSVWPPLVEPVETTPAPLVEPVETTPAPLVEPVETTPRADSRPGGPGRRRLLTARPV